MFIQQSVRSVCLCHISCSEGSGHRLYWLVARSKQCFRLQHNCIQMCGSSGRFGRRLVAYRLVGNSGSTSDLNGLLSPAIKAWRASSLTSLFRMLDVSVLCDITIVSDEREFPLDFVIVHHEVGISLPNQPNFDVAPVRTLCPHMLI